MESRRLPRTRTSRQVADHAADLAAKNPIKRNFDWVWSATADRLEVIIDCLTNRAVAGEVELDNALAARLVAYARRAAKRIPTWKPN
jgi:hypothetical protein